MSRKTRVRFAPSPTGPLHMGGVRTALYNYLYAKQNGGDFILRIEDTDSHRFVPGAEQYIIEALSWCGIVPDEGVDASGKVVETPSARHPHAPYRQSQRKPIYRQYAEQLIANGYAYYAFDTADELAARRAEAEAAKQTFIYNQVTRKTLRNSLTLPAEETARLLETTTDWTIRFKMPENTVVVMDDLIRGHIEVNTDTLDDKVLWKRADELPTYHLANIVDDHLMEITEVIRGEEWLPSLPLHYMLYKAFGWEDTMPRFAQSRGYREDGYFPEAFVNLLAFLGWNPGDDREILSMDELVQAFSLDRIVRSGARFSVEKAHWYNREYLRMKSTEELTGLFIPILEQNGIHREKDYVAAVVALTRERVTFVADFWTVAKCLFVAPDSYDEKDTAKFWTAENAPLVSAAASWLCKDYSGPWTKEGIEEALVEHIRSQEWPMGKVMNALRLALTGAASGLGIADLAALLGPAEVAARVASAEKALMK